MRHRLYPIQLKYGAIFSKKYVNGTKFRKFYLTALNSGHSFVVVFLRKKVYNTVELSEIKHRKISKHTIVPTIGSSSIPRSYICSKGEIVKKINFGAPSGEP